MSINSIRSLLARLGENDFTKRFTDEGRRGNVRNVEYTWSPAIDAANIEDRRVNRKKAAGGGERACGESGIQTGSWKRYRVRGCRWKNDGRKKPGS